jgi:hypothetical protein
VAKPVARPVAVPPPVAPVERVPMAVSVGRGRLGRRLAALAEALDFLRARLLGRSRIDRRLAHAAHAVALCVQALLFETAGERIRKEALLELLVATEARIGGQTDERP